MMVRERTWRRVVVVEVCNARNLKPKDRQGTTCVYAVVDFDGQRRCTGAATCSGDLNLQWGEMLKFRVHDPDTMVLKTLKLNLYNEKKAIAAAGSGRRNRTFLGKVQITGASFAKEGEEVLSYYPLQKWSVFSQIKGEIGLKIWFVDEPEPHDMLYLGTLVPQNFDQLSISDDENMDSTLPMEMVEGLEDVVSLAASSPAKPTVSTATSQENNHEPSPLTPPSKGPAWEEFLSSWSEARLLQHSLQMDTYNALERMLVDESEEPRPLTLSLLETITNNFSEDMKVGSGGFSVVYKGALGSKMVAVKKLSGAMDMDEKQFIKEIQCLMKARHKNIVRFLGYCADTQGLLKDFGGKPVLADVRNRALCFEYVPKGSLDKHITDASCGLEWVVRYRIIEGICEGLHYLHKNHILHLDLKPANILLYDNMVPKIADFGLSRRLDQNQSAIIATTIVGSLGYFAPECYDGKFSYKSDIYSLGVVIMEILTGNKFPTVEDALESWRNRLEASREDIPLEHVKVCVEAATMCVNLSAAKRPTTHHIIEILKYPGGTDEFKKDGASTSSAANLTKMA